ncbi:MULTISPECIES: hypothetical protein [unclassified Nitratiruptor]|uniref:hypothetical protein n=1 Tax=unclassified Nitratiruptor TaxID=2624044 RepID=UPI001915BCA9|nr:MULTISPECIES: hypothetical protein [unclassified Nitratiruptor]BCD59332.1 hypothetical protein NitYY0810_C0062 [Nitratiruptor sp. YY08-10]BCD63256.1 hypothetical protein NitYY0814_C0062 [Nitratiruptor sp. YY08-14]
MKELFSIIPRLPGVRVYLFAEDKESTLELANFCQEKGHYLEIAALEDEIFETLQDVEGGKLRRIDENKERYNQRSMMFDTIFVPYDIGKLQDKELFFRKIYRMMKNAADLIILVQNEEAEALESLLQELNYIAINPIEYQDKTALTAKKMHGWARV